MKLDQLIVQHFYNSKKLTLQGIGNFLLNYNVEAGVVADKNVEIPDGAIEFEYDSRAGEDADLISFIVEKTRKIRPLASADLDSFVALGKQFLNIGKPFRLEGIGTLIKGQSGSYEFTPGLFIAPKLEASPTPFKEKLTEEISFNTEKKSTGILNKKALIIGGVLAILLAGGVGAWMYMNKNKPAGEEANQTKPSSGSNQITVNTVSNDTAKSTVAKPDSLQPKPVVPASDGYTFKVVFKETTQILAEKSKTRLESYGHDNIMILPRDSATVYLLSAFKRPLSDTALVLDSMKKYLAAPKAYIKLN